MKTYFVIRIMLKTRKLLLLDGAGAIASTLSLGVLLPAFRQHIGLPITVLYLLAGLAGLLVLYSFIAYFFFAHRWKRFLLGAALANLSYCAVTLLVLFNYLEQLELLGIVYFVGELAIVMVLATYELKVALSYE